MEEGATVSRPLEAVFLDFDMPFSTIHVKWLRKAGPSFNTRTSSYWPYSAAQAARKAWGGKKNCPSLGGTESDSQTIHDSAGAFERYCCRTGSKCSTWSIVEKSKTMSYCPLQVLMSPNRKSSPGNLRRARFSVF